MTTPSRRQMPILMLLILLLSSMATVSSFSPVPLGLGALLFKPAGMKTRPCLGQESDLLKAADFFTDAFWTGKVGGTKKLSEKQQRSLYNSQLVEFRRRYGKKLGGDRRAELVLVENGNEELMGVAAVEVELVPEKSLTSTAKTRAPLMSNVAVSRKWRRRGIAEVLVKEIERMVRIEWGYDDIFLYVEQRNKPAIKLYQKMGYNPYWIDKNAKTLVPTTDGSMQNEPTTLVCMKKRLNKRGLFSRFFQ